ncbi:uncharacterized protein METZ01_LOCUS367617, partial [marine metagenome]
MQLGLAALSHKKFLKNQGFFCVRSLIVWKEH